MVAAGGQHLITYFQAIVIGLLQGVTELFPISSLGHAVILPKLLGWNLSQDKPSFLAFLVATHLATAIVLFVFFLPEWVRILKGLGRSLRDRQIGHDDPDARLAWLLVVGTIPAGLIGLLFEHKLRSLFASPTAAAAFLAVNGLILFAAEYLRRRAPGAEARARELERGAEADTSAEAEKRLATLGFREAELPELVGHHGDGVRGQALVGALSAGVAAWFAIKFLMRYFQTNTLTPFAVYCLFAGLAALLVFVF